MAFAKLNRALLFRSQRDTLSQAPRFLTEPIRNPIIATAMSEITRSLAQTRLDLPTTPPTELCSTEGELRATTWAKVLASVRSASRQAAAALSTANGIWPLSASRRIRYLDPCPAQHRPATQVPVTIARIRATAARIRVRVRVRSPTIRHKTVPLQGVPTLSTRLKGMSPAPKSPCREVDKRSHARPECLHIRTGRDRSPSCSRRLARWRTH